MREARSTLSSNWPFTLIICYAPDDPFGYPPQPDPLWNPCNSATLRYFPKREKGDDNYICVSTAARPAISRLTAPYDLSLPIPKR